MIIPSSHSRGGSANNGQSTVLPAALGEGFLLKPFPSLLSHFLLFSTMLFTLLAAEVSLRDVNFST